MNRIDLAIEVVRQIGGSKKEALKYIDAVVEGIKTGMKQDGDVKIANFGTFSTAVKPEHKARNPKTGEQIIVKEKLVPKIKFAESVKEMIN